MASVLPLRTKSLREQVSAEEWETRVDLAACYRLVALYGMTDLVYNHITARVPASNHVLINPYGMLYEEITASSLIKIDLDGNTVLQPEHDYSVNAAGYVIHSAVHTAQARCRMRDPYAYPRRNRRQCARRRPAAALANRHAIYRPSCLPRLRRAGVQQG